jgi:hypothetical protein
MKKQMVVCFKQQDNQNDLNKKAAQSCFFIEVKDLEVFIDLLSMRGTMNGT